MNIEPIGDRVLVKVLEDENKTASGIILPETAKEKPQRGLVVAVAENDYDEAPPVSVGDTIIFAKYSGTEIKVDQDKYLVLETSDILARIKD